MSSIIDLAKNFAFQNIPFLMDKGEKAFKESKKKITEYSINQKIKSNYKKIGQIIYNNRININNASIKTELETIASFYLDIKNNNNIIKKLSR